MVKQYYLIKTSHSESTQNQYEFKCTVTVFKGVKSNQKLYSSESTSIMAKNILEKRKKRLNFTKY